MIRSLWLHFTAGLTEANVPMNLVSMKFIEEIYVEIILCLIYFGLHRNSGQTFLLRFTEPVSSIGIAGGAITLSRECENK